MSSVVEAQVLAGALPGRRMVDILEPGPAAGPVVLSPATPHGDLLRLCNALLAKIVSLSSERDAFRRQCRLLESGQRRKFVCRTCGREHWRDEPGMPTGWSWRPKSGHRCPSCTNAFILHHGGQR